MFNLVTHILESTLTKKIVFLIMLFGLLIAVNDNVSAQILERVEVKNYDLRWNDAGSGHKNDLALWHPKAPSGYFVFGSIGWGSNGYDPNGKIITYAFKPLHNVSTAQGQLTPIVNPVDYAQGWLDKGSGAKRDGSVWVPVCPKNYQPLGLVVNSGHSKPSTKDCGCILMTADLMTLKENVRLNYSWFSSGVAKNGITLQNLLREGTKEAVFYTMSLNTGAQMLGFIPNTGIATATAKKGSSPDIINSAFRNAPNAR